jgi:hypothetical protein
MSLTRAISTVVMILITQAPSRAQQPDTMITFGGLRVAACAVSPDPGYGLTASKPIQIGGGPAYADSRMTRYIGALRGPNGEVLRIAGRGSLPAPPGYSDEITILDNYRIAVGDQTVSLYVDDYHYGIPKAPMGLTCAGPLVTALGVPPLDPQILARSMVSLAIEEGTVREFPAVPLDVSTPRGFLYDQFTMIAQRAHAAANMGTPMDPKKPPSDIDPAGLVVLAFPLPCGDRTITPQRIELSGPQGPVQQNGIIKDDALLKMFPAMKLPMGSLAARFRQSQVSGIKIVYSEACNATPAEVSLLVRMEAPRSPLRPIPLPPGVIEAEPVIYLQVIVDPLGEFCSAVYIGGPKSLLPAALEAVGKLRSDPLRLNGVAIEYPAVIPLVFQ